jgi:hypothetical protein
VTQPVQAAPTPFTPVCGVGQDATGRPLVLIRYHTITGTIDLFCSPDEADAQAALLTQAARQARTGLIIPGPGGVPDAAQAARSWQAATNAAINGARS